jgi:hypothetical protein
MRFSWISWASPSNTSPRFLSDMSHRAAIREEHDPFAVLGLFPSFLRVLVFLRWTSYACPHCGQVFRRDFWPEKVRLGHGQRACDECGAVFDDGTREWPQLSVFKKLRFFFPPLLIGISGGLLLAAILVSILPQRDWRVAVVGLILALIPLFFWSLIRWPWVFRSIRRYNATSTSK